MMRRKILIYAVALGVSLVASYLKWTEPPEASTAEDEEDSIVVIPGKAEDVVAVAWKADEKEVHLKVQNDERGRYVWVETTERKTKIKRKVGPPDPAPDQGGGTTADGVETSGGTGGAAGETTGGTGAETPSEPPKPPKIEHESVLETRTFKGSKAVEDLLDRYGPLKARAVFSDVAARREDFGLHEPNGVLTVEREGREPRVFQAGDDLYGGKAVYLYDENEDKVYLVDVAAVASMRTLRNLEEQSLSGLDEQQVVSAVVEGRGATVELVQHNRDDREAFYWGGTDGERNESAMAWMDKLFRLRTTGYVQPGDEPTDLNPQLEVRLTGEDDEVLGIEFLQGTDPDGESAWYARSDHTRGLVRIAPAAASELVQDVGALGSGQGDAGAQAPDSGPPPGAG